MKGGCSSGMQLSRPNQGEIEARVEVDMKTMISTQVMRESGRDGDGLTVGQAAPAPRTLLGPITCKVWTRITMPRNLCLPMSDPFQFLCP